MVPHILVILNLTMPVSWLDVWMTLLRTYRANTAAASASVNHKHKIYKYHGLKDLGGTTLLCY